MGYYQLGQCLKYSDPKNFEKILSVKCRASKDLYRSSSNVLLREKRTDELNRHVPNFHEYFVSGSKRECGETVPDPYESCLATFVN
jgi:hypothetical protein